MPMLQFDFFFLKDLNWYYKPQNYIIKNFLEKEYDILINFVQVIVFQLNI